METVVRLTAEWFHLRMRKKTSGYHNYLLKGLNFWYMYCIQKHFSE